jgi:hypothetical protein
MRLTVVAIVFKSDRCTASSGKPLRSFKRCIQNQDRSEPTPVPKWTPARRRRAAIPHASLGGDWRGNQLLWWVAPKRVKAGPYLIVGAAAQVLTTVKIPLLAGSGPPRNGVALALNDGHPRCGLNVVLATRQPWRVTTRHATDDTRRRSEGGFVTRPRHKLSEGATDADGRHDCCDQEQQTESPHCTQPHLNSHW